MTSCWYLEPLYNENRILSQWSLSLITGKQLQAETVNSVQNTDIIPPIFIYKLTHNNCIRLWDAIYYLARWMCNIMFQLGQTYLSAQTLKNFFLNIPYIIFIYSHTKVQQNTKTAHFYDLITIHNHSLNFPQLLFLILSPDNLYSALNHLRDVL